MGEDGVAAGYAGLKAVGRAGGTTLNEIAVFGGGGRRNGGTEGKAEGVAAT